MSTEETNNGTENPELESGTLKETVHLSQMYQNWFLDYASYVILERAVPEITDGLKPGGKLVVNTAKSPDEIRKELNFSGTVATVDGTGIARKEMGVPIANTTMIGALLKVTGVM